MRSAALSCSFGTADAGRVAARSRLARRVLELDRGVADVVADAEVAMQRLLGLAPAEAGKVRQPARPRRRPNRCCSKKRTVSSMVSRKQYGSGSSASAIVAPGALRCSRTRWAAWRTMLSAMRSTTPGASASGLKVPGTVLTLPSRPGSSGSSVGQQIGQQVGVGQPLLVLPVGLVDLLLDPHAVEGAVGKAVDREDVEVVRVQQAAAAAASARGSRSASAATADSRRPTPSGRSGANAALTAGR